MHVPRTARGKMMMRTKEGGKAKHELKVMIVVASAIEKKRSRECMPLATELAADRLLQH